jgi:hypothetical protein
MNKDFKRWVYHATKSPKIVNDSEFERLQAEGWADSPAEFMDLTLVGLDLAKIAAGDKQEIAKAQQAKDAVEGVKNALNGQLNLKQMSKAEVKDYAADHLGLDMNNKKTKNTMVKEIKAAQE